MFKKLFRRTEKSKELQIVAPLNGQIVPLQDVPDPVFGQKMMGEGIAIIPKDGKVVSPVHGKIIQIPNSKHAVGIEAEDGSEILIHVGLETVALKGEGFEGKVSAGDDISVGDPLIEFDLEYIKEHADHSITPIVITNSANSNKTYTFTKETEATAGETVIITVSE
ncbi:MAG TPA: PTS glucose transporter subunit IIA [Bacillota bacterium]|nr:PTS glucose transporter subunit IIA [Bacillota bacterium]